MEQYEKKIKYEKIIYNLKIVNREIDKFNNNMNMFKNKAKKNIIIDKHIFNEKTIDNVLYTSEQSLKDITYNIIPSLNRSKYD